MNTAQQNEDCYFYMDESLPEEQRTMNAMCVKCHKNENKGWLWEGSKRGYGPYEITCDICGYIIYQPQIMRSR